MCASFSLYIYYPIISTCLSVCEVILAESLPEQPVLSEAAQFRTDLAQADQVPAVRQTLHDVQLQAGGQVSQSHACRFRLEETAEIIEYNGENAPKVCILNTPLNAAVRFTFWADAYPVDLNVVQLMLPLHDVLHAVHPRIDVPHQHRLAHVLNKTAQRDIERLQQLLDGTDVLLVDQDCGRGNHKFNYYNHDPK